MKLPKNIWDQLKNKSADALISALVKDDWEHDETRGAQRVYLHPDGRRVSIHYHPGKTYGPRLLKALLADIGWSIPDMRRLKLIK
ncbi:MAG: addiction module toxin, HicA family [Chloroflexi bacterium]|nr:addiction module toxin, HicA family [Chloroflexota bacterium]MBM3154078.1 addiction module toxin, HicA family [Chloroflexota bacterium]MBM3173625.1 addiction module toxin, HicA family [Chloroflexota bacterium]MBM3175346.1 addiction module toxin, HicA family [Chloroflexota bacterium]MBM4450722.1 addiction module toxin, HicA family [Chloroflexota bacterium]